ncbi:MAG: cytochrome c3 family protein [Gemmatimonas sp.]
MTLRAHIMSAAAVVVFVCALGARALFAAPQVSRSQPTGFPHDAHATVFPMCTTCHAGVLDPEKSVFPEPAACGACHDGVTKPVIVWEPRTGPRDGNLRFTHAQHDRAATSKSPADSTLIRNCSACHVQTGAQRMSVRHAVVGQCLDCHGLKGSHVDIDRNACATCHLSLSNAPNLTREHIARFPKPSSHLASDFVLGGHGKAAIGTGRDPRASGIAANCATCHARNLCVTCHVNAPDIPAIRALAMDERPPAYTASLPTPSNHSASDFQRAHGKAASRPSATCAVCHARGSCMRCHVGVPPRVIAGLPEAGPGRAEGATVTRTPPASHTVRFREGHGPEASVRPKSCETCHERSTCLTCHRPDGARQSGYHPQQFLTRHPAAAYSRASNCGDCHNAAQFCQSCHQRSGLVATTRLGRAGYHDAFRSFSLGHGQAARQNLESCASCHAERDCTACHSAIGGGFRFNPHGPGFNAARARAKNPSVCIACHGRVIPGDR